MIAGPTDRLTTHGGNGTDAALAGARRGHEDAGLPQEIAPGLAYLRCVLVNAYFIGERPAGDRGWVLVDAGIPGSLPAIVRAAAARYGADARPAAIVLTHGHFDHVGAVEALARRWDVPVYAHPLELPYLTGRSKYPPFDPTVGGGTQPLLSVFFPEGPVDLGARAQPLPEDGSVPFASGWRWMHTPGHSPGHVSLVRDEDRVVVAGDAVVTTRQESTLAVLTQEPGVSRPPAYATCDWAAAAGSARAIANLVPELLATGHGVPMRGAAMRRQLYALARDFERVAVPEHGRYVGRPARTDARGVVSVPPAVPDPRLRRAAGIGLALVAGAALASLTTRQVRARRR